MNKQPPAPRIGPMTALLHLLVKSGVRIAEALSVRWRHLRLHDPNGARLEIPDSKTDTGIREVELSADLVEILTTYLEDQRRAGIETTPTMFVFPGQGGNKRTPPRRPYQRIVKRANARREAAGLPPLPDRVTFHTLRRTYISLILVASDYDLAYVMAQVGHADHSTTLEIYNKLQKRLKRDHGLRFDALLTDARVLLAQPSQEPA